MLRKIEAYGAIFAGTFVAVWWGLIVAHSTAAFIVGGILILAGILTNEWGDR